jgi:hypothetical protein
MNDKKLPEFSTGDHHESMAITAGDKPALDFDAMSPGPLDKKNSLEINGHVIRARTSGLAFAEVPETSPNLMEGTVITATGTEEASCELDIKFEKSATTVAVGVHQPKASEGSLTFLDAQGKPLGKYDTNSSLRQYMFSSDSGVKTLHWTSTGGASLDNIYLLGV